MTLARFQRQFQAGLMAGDLSAVAGSVVQAAGLDVHTHAARAMLVEALADNFDKTLNWLGGDAFTDLALAYIAISPSHSWTLADYGADFAEYLRRSLPGDGEVAEIAALDWALRTAFGAADPQPGTWAQEPHIDWDHLRLRLAPGAALLAMTTNADSIWTAIPDTPIDALLSAGVVLVWRDGQEPRFRRLPAGEADLLVAIAAGQMFGTACTSCGASIDQIGLWLREWLSAGLVLPRA